MVDGDWTQALHSLSDALEKRHWSKNRKIKITTASAVSFNKRTICRHDLLSIIKFKATEGHDRRHLNLAVSGDFEILSARQNFDAKHEVGQNELCG